MKIIISFFRISLHVGALVVTCLFLWCHKFRWKTRNFSFHFFQHWFIVADNAIATANVILLQHPYAVNRHRLLENTSLAMHSKATRVSTFLVFIYFSLFIFRYHYFVLFPLWNIWRRECGFRSNLACLSGADRDSRAVALPHSLPLSRNLFLCLVCPSFCS